MKIFTRLRQFGPEAEILLQLLVIAALFLGLLVGLRTFTAPAVLWLMRRPGPLALVLAALAVFEYVVDLNPKAPPRTQPLGLIARICSGGFCGWSLMTAGGGPVALGVAAGALGAIAGTYGGLAARMRAIALIGRIPAAIVEDCFAVVASAAVVFYM
jgi:uncharacterized membrane protein